MKDEIPDNVISLDDYRRNQVGPKSTQLYSVLLWDDNEPRAITEDLSPRDAAATATILVNALLNQYPNTMESASHQSTIYTHYIIGLFDQHVYAKVEVRSQ